MNIILNKKLYDVGMLLTVMQSKRNTAIGEQKYGTQDHCIPTISFTALVLSETTLFGCIFDRNTSNFQYYKYINTGSFLNSLGMGQFLK